MTIDGKYRNERTENVLFNSALNTFYLLLYCVGHMVKENSDRGETRFRQYKDVCFRLGQVRSDEVRGFNVHIESKHACHGHRYRPFPFSSKGSFICIIPHSIHHGICYTGRGTLAGTMVNTRPVKCG